MATGRMTGRMTGAAGGEPARLMTSVGGAGYQSKPGTSSTRAAAGFDPLNQGNRGPAPPLVKKSDNSPEDMAREMEKQVNALIEASADAAARGDAVQALERAKEAGKKERLLQRHRESNGLVDQINMDLTYAVCFNLANAYHKNEMFTEALSTYTLIVKNKQYPQAGRLRVNMGNIYFQDKKYTFAIKMYRMALDQIPNTGKEMRLKIMRNIGNAFVRLGQFQDAIQSYEAIMDGNPDFQTGFNLLVCYYALGDEEKMRKGFARLLSIPMPRTTEDEEEDAKDADDDDTTTMAADILREELKERQKKATRYITMAAKLIAPTLDPKDWSSGFDWVIETLKHDHELIAGEIKISKALTFLRKKQFDKAIDVLKSFERMDQMLKAKAATNLSFLYFLEGDVGQADKYANLAVRHDRYNAKALVNKGNCLNEKGELERAKELYLEAIGVEADCVEAIYNLGLVNKHLGILSESLQAFEKLHTIIPNSPEVIYQIANLHDMLGNFRSATKYLNYLLTRVPSDPGALSRLGQILSKDDDENLAFHYHFESYRYFPVNLDVISWLGVWYVKGELYEKAIQFFERAAEIQPKEEKWQLMVTSCYRRMGNFQKALELYEAIHKQYPDNLECLRYLVAICKDLNRKYDHYENKLLLLERTVSNKHASMTNAAPRGSGPGYGAGPAGPGIGGPGIGGPGMGGPGPAGPGMGYGAGPGMGPGSPDGPGMGRIGAPDLGSPGSRGAPPSVGGADEDDFADADLDDLLAD